MRLPKYQAAQGRQNPDRSSHYRTRYQPHLNRGRPDLGYQQADSCLSSHQPCHCHHRCRGYCPCHLDPYRLIRSHQMGTHHSHHQPRRYHHPDHRHSQGHPHQNLIGQNSQLRGNCLGNQISHRHQYLLRPLYHPHHH